MSHNSEVYRVAPQEMAEKIIRMYSIVESTSYAEARHFASIAVGLVLSAHPTKKISSSAIEYDYDFWNEVKNNI